jgi:RNA-directed DNA polymerase
LHPANTKIVDCKRRSTTRKYPRTSFTFFEFTFRRGPQPATDQMFLSFATAISKDALNRISREVRCWRLRRWIELTFAPLANTVNPTLADCDAVLPAGSTNQRCIHSSCGSTPAW